MALYQVKVPRTKNEEESLVLENNAVYLAGYNNRQTIIHNSTDKYIFWIENCFGEIKRYGTQNSNS